MTPSLPTAASVHGTVMKEGLISPALAADRSRLVFWQPGLACSLDNPLEFLAERWIVGILRSVLRQGLYCESRSDLQKLRNRRRRFGFLTSPGIRGGEVCPGAPERLTGCRRLQAPFDRRRVARQVGVRVAQ